MILYFDGCSHTDGHCFHFDNSTSVEQYNWTHLVSKKLLKNYKTLKTRDESYENIINTITKNKNIILDASYSGKSNPSIVHGTVHLLSKLYKNNIKIDYSFIQITGVSRNIMFDHTGIPKDITPNDNLPIGIRFEPFASNQTLLEIYFLQLFFQKYKIKDLYIPYFKINTKDNFLDINHRKFTKSPNIGYIDIFRDKGYVCDENGHPNIKGNEIIAKDVLKKIKNDHNII